MQSIMIIGVYMWGAMYTAGVFVAALSLGNHATLYLALVSAGFAYLAQFAGAYATGDTPSLTAWKANVVLTCIAAGAGIAAGVTLIIGA